VFNKKKKYVIVVISLLPCQKLAIALIKNRCCYGPAVGFVIARKLQHAIDGMLCRLWMIAHTFTSPTA